MAEMALQSNGLHLQAGRQVMRLQATQGGWGEVLCQLHHRNTRATVGSLLKQMTKEVVSPQFK